MTLWVFRDEAGNWRWNARARNGRIVATSGESFDSKGNAKKAARRVMRWPHLCLRVREVV